MCSPGVRRISHFPDPDFWTAKRDCQPTFEEASRLAFRARGQALTETRRSSALGDARQLTPATNRAYSLLRL